MQRDIVRWLVAGCVLSLTIGCVTLTEDQKFDRINRLAEAEEEFLARKAQCVRNGGAMWMKTRPIGRPDYLDFKTAKCVRRR